MTTPRILTLPGWQGSGPEHWQTCWESLYGAQRVEQTDWLWPRRGDWMARLEEVLLGSPEPAWLVAHSLGCQLVAAWAAHSRHADRVKGALLVAPADVERDDLPPHLHGWKPMARQLLPFRSLTVISADDPFCSVARAEAMGAAWGSPLRCIGSAGHVNADSGLGDWPQGRALFDKLVKE